MQHYTPQTRHDWLVANLRRFDEAEMGYREIALDIKRTFGLDKPPSPATIGRALKEARSEGIQPYSDEAMRLLEPDNFPEFRKLFPAPNGEPYQTNATHHALHWVIYSLTRKVDIPDWVIAHFDLPLDVNQDIVEREKLLTFVLLLAPRHGKTMTVIHSLISLICEYPDVRIIYCQGVLKTTQLIMSMVMAEMEHNERLKAMYGPFRDDEKMWSQANGFVVARRTIQAISPTFLPAGINSNVRSLDGDIIIIDDPQDLERAESEATTAKDYSKITTEFMTRREPHTPVLMIGSHLPTPFGDVFTQLEDNLAELQTEGQAIIMRKRPAHDLDRCEGPPHEVCVEWPEYRNWNFLESQRALLGHELFEAVYQQVARIPGTRSFEPEVVKEYRHNGGILDANRSWKEVSRFCWDDECRGRMFTAQGFDPAAGEGKKASYSALVVMQGCIRCRTLYLVDYWQRRQSPEKHVGTIVSFARAFNIEWLRVEINAYQKALARDEKLRDAAREYRFNIDEWMTDDRKNTPEFGIPNLALYMRDGKFSQPAKTAQDEMYGKELTQALVRYPNKPNDLPMAVWLAAGMIWTMWELYANPDPIYLPGRDDFVPAYMVDEPLRVDLSLYRD